MGYGAIKEKGALMADYSQYQHLLFERKEHGILLMTINRPESLNATNARLHWELSRVWLDIRDDPETRVVVVTGAGRAFSAGGDLAMIEGFQNDLDKVSQTMKEAGDIVYNITNLDTPVVSAINGVAVGAGLAVALMADISIIAETARITDGHVRLGVGAGDHAAIIWPLLCGLAKAKYYLLTADFIDGKEAERIGLVSLCVPQEEVVPKAMEVATKLATGSQLAVRWTKRALNNWVRQAGPIFDNSLALEMLGFFSNDVTEGINAIKEKRAPVFPSAQGV
jgi:enoyl-CoA hydratase